VSVEGYCGLFGSGKSQAMVLEAYKARRKDPECRVMTNLEVLNLPGRDVEFLRPTDSLEETMQKMVRFEADQGHKAYLLLDEVGVYLNARVWSKMPAELTWRWQQLRKDGVELRWTCIRPNNVVKDLRDITFETHWCESYKHFGFFVLSHYAYTAVGDKRSFRSRSLQRFRPKLLAELYNTMGKVQAAQFARS
jgi:hypothetical protein